MARINIEDSLFRDDRFLELVARLGNKTLAFGVVVEGFILAQKHYLSDSKLIPLNEWQRNQYGQYLVDVGFAKLLPNGVYLSGSEKSFAWLVQKADAGKNCSDKKLEALKKARTAKSNRSEETLNGSERVLNASEPLTLTLSPTLSLTQERIKKERKGTSGVNPPEPKSGELIVQGEDKKNTKDKNKVAKEAYVNAYRQRYQKDPIQDAQFHSIIAHIVRRVGPEEAALILDFYVRHNKPFYAEKCHAIRFCLADIESLAVQTAKGRQILKSDLKRFEEQTDVVQLSAEDISNIRADRTRGLLNEPSNG